MRLSLVILLLVACSHPAPPPAPHASTPAATWKGPAILAKVPADTPYLVAVLEPMPPALREHWFADNIKQVKEALHKAASGEGRVALVAAALYAELDGADDAHWPEALGLSTDSRMVLYGLSIWPVMRVEVKDAARVREVLGRVVKAGDPELQPRTVGRATIYQLTQKDATFIFGTVDSELVAAIIPPDLVDRALPAIIGDEVPAHSLRDGRLVPSLLASHHFLPTMLAYGDVARTLEVMSGHGKGQYDPLAARFAGKIPPTCDGDLARIAATFPRLVLGYRHLDQQGFTVTMALEAPAAILQGLAKLHTPMPVMPVTGRPLVALGAAVNVDAMLTWLRDTAGQLRAHPFRCDALAELNTGIDELAAKLDQPLPPMLLGLRGFELVVDDATMMPPSGTGHLLVAGDHIADLVRQLLSKVPQLAGLQVQPNGTPLELPLDKLGVPASFKSAHFALRETRAALAFGDSSAQRATERVAAPDANAPLFVVSYDLPKLRKQFGMFFKGDNLDGLNLGRTSLALDVGADGIDLDVVGTWAPGSAAPH